MRNNLIVGVTMLCGIGICSSGCSYQRSFGQGKVMETTAEDRVIMTMPVGVGSMAGQVNPVQITCAEPSPDVAKIVSESTNIANSFQAQVTDPKSGIQGDLNTTLALSKARAEALAQLTTRLATIQLLRDGLFRACEAYANGAISDTAYALVLSRYGDVMVTMLLGELAAGRSGGTQVTIGSTASGGANAPPGETPSSDSATGTAPAASGNTPSVGSAHANAAAGQSGGSGTVVTTTTPSDAPAIADSLVALQKRFVNNKGQLAPLLVSCVSALDRRTSVLSPVGTIPSPTPFQTLCENAFNKILPELPGILKSNMRQDESKIGQESQMGRASASVTASTPRRTAH